MIERIRPGRQRSYGTRHGMRAGVARRGARARVEVRSCRGLHLAVVAYSAQKALQLQAGREVLLAHALDDSAAAARLRELHAAAVPAQEVVDGLVVNLDRAELQQKLPAGRLRDGGEDELRGKQHQALNGMRLATARLAVRKDGGVLARERLGEHAAQNAAENVAVAGTRRKHSIIA